MERNYVYLILITVYFLLLSCSDWKVPEALVGNWKGKKKVNVRYNKDKTSDYKFIKAPDSVSMTLIINGNGQVTGSFGNARFEGCQIQKNRGWIGRKLNLATDFIITGQLTGSIFPADTLMNKEISLPCDLEENMVSGGIFQKHGMGVFPMTGVHLTKQN